MERREFDGYSDRVVAWAREAAGVLGLILVGSTAARTHEPDEWSDHDLFVVAEPARCAALRDATRWLPARRCGIVLHEQDTEHGGWAVFGDGHLVEYAVFAPTDLIVSRSGTARVAVDRMGGLDAVLRPTLAAPSRDPGRIATRLHRCLLVGAGRAARGERLAARRHLLDAADALLALRAELEGAPDAQDPWRRVELVDPALASELDGILAVADVAAARRLAALAARLGSSSPWWPGSLADAVGTRLVLGATTVDPALAPEG